MRKHLRAAAARRIRDALFASYLQRDGYTHARIDDRGGCVVYFVVAGTPIQTLTFRAGDMLVRDGG